MKFMRKRFLFGLLLLVLIGVLWYCTPWKNIITLDALHAHHKYFREIVHHYYPFAVIVFVASLAACIAVALPASPPFALLGSYLFGFIPGFFYSLAGCVIGATFSFLIVRYFVKHWFIGKHGQKIDQFNEQFKHYGASYLLMLHFLSVIPYIVITILAAMAEVPLKTFVWTLFVGSIPLLLVYSWTARELVSLTSAHTILSPRLFIIFGLLIAIAVLPIILKRYKSRLIK